MDEGVCSFDLQSLPIRLSVTRTGVRKSITFADNTFFSDTHFLRLHSRQKTSYELQICNAGRGSVCLYVGQV